MHKISHFSELSNFLSEKSSVCNDFLSVLDKFRLSQSLRKLRMEKQKGTSSLDLLKYLLIFRLFSQTIHQSLRYQFAPLISATLLTQRQERKGLTTCRQYKSSYARVKAEYDGIPVQLFIIRYGKSTQYEVIVTTDMTLSFKEAFERYQIRWNIEVLFYESKQHLELGRCQSTDLNAQIADCTLAFIGYSVISLHKRFTDVSVRNLR